MTREEAKELLPIIQAFAAGKQIQDSIEGLTDWVDTDEINLEYEGQEIKHRIKPEPKYRPFKTKEECWNEMHKHPDFGWIVSKKGLEFCHICDMFTSTSNSLMITLGIDQSNPYEADKYFNNYTFTDGTPFGIKEE